MKKLRMFFAVATIIGIIGGLSAFSSKKIEIKKKTDGYFYKYKLSTFGQNDVTNFANYERSSNTCDDGSNVCGVFLATDEGAGNQPDESEFNAVASDIWLSQHDGTSQEPGTIIMQN